MSKLFFTIFTPVYNRKHTIHRVWESLIQQTNKNFEWIIVNDGSDDGVEPLLESYKEKADFDVRIFNQKNSGKHIAFNKAIEEARGELLIDADSDDGFDAKTVETFDRLWTEYKNDSLSGIIVLCKDEDNNIIGDKFPIEGISSYKDIVYKYKIGGDKFGCMKVDILKEYRWPDKFGVKYFPESYVWSQIGVKYDCVCMNIPLYTVYFDAGNQLTNSEDLSMNVLKSRNFYTVWWINTILPEVSEYLTVLDTLKAFASLWKSTLLIKESPLSAIKQIKKTKAKIWALLTFIPSFIMVKIFRF